jgi:anti-sigma B factor antagonist
VIPQAREVPNDLLELSSSTLDGATVVHLAGEIDLSTAPFLQDELLRLTFEDGVTDLVIDLRDVEFMDSTGVGAIAASYRHLRDRDGRLALAGPTPSIAKVCDISGLARVLPMARTVEEAVAGLRGRRQPA